MQTKPYFAFILCTSFKENIHKHCFTNHSSTLVLVL